MNTNMEDLNEFQHAVNLDIKNEATLDQSDLIRSDPHAWHDELIRILTRLDHQLTRSKINRFDEHERYVRERQKIITTLNNLEQQHAKIVSDSNHWRTNALNFRRATLERLQEAKTSLRREDQISISVISGEHGSAQELAQLRQAIARHKERMTRDEDEPEVVDEELWQACGLLSSRAVHA